MEEQKNRTNIITIGGGTGTYNVLTGLKKYVKYNLAAIVTMSDSGGSSGVLRDEFWELPAGDIRRAIVALSHRDKWTRDLLNYRIQGSNDSDLVNHPLGNLLLMAASQAMDGDFEKWLEKICDMFRVRGKIFPVTFEDTHLGVILEDGQEILWEKNIDIPLHDGNIPIREAFLSPKAPLNPKAARAIAYSDVVIIGPWDLYTSIIPNLLATGMREALQETKARKEEKWKDFKIIYLCNIMTKYGETTHFWVRDFVQTLEKYLWENVIDFVVVNNGYISDVKVEKYFREDKKKPVKIKESDAEFFAKRNYTVIEEDLLHTTDLVRHSPKKIADVVRDIIEGWVK